MTPIYHIQTWLADRLSWIQYPRLRRMPAKAPSSPLNWLDKGLILLACLPLLVAGLFGIAFGGFMLYIIIGSFF